ncbi:hypothetical protein Pla110_22930 [Polystyrenella longa]|uniref:Uncharacterized protein n=1 Tax=Polystyrenella longa TaxID=2528007 RepID=A0A518CMV6_9PLAN|nr:YdjY domain-containing protein [Polystyrenella longa]QDU80562.1 hypothetical protein Pla110_22930 [Polystyrenella longa]
MNSRRPQTSKIILTVVFAFYFLLGVSLVTADEPVNTDAGVGEQNTASLIPLNKEKTVLIDRAGNRLLVKGKIVLQRGLLEMFCCLDGSKEHESIVSTSAKAYVVHGGLLALGAEAGSPVKYYPEYTAPKGQKMEVNVIWTDKEGKEQKADAQSWIRYVVERYYYVVVDPFPSDLTLPENGEGDLRYDDFNKELYWFGHMTKDQRAEMKRLSKNEEYQKAIDVFYERSQPREMDSQFIFTGSRFVKDEETDEQFYLAEDGCLICVANMPTAMIDVSIESSSQGTDSLLFEPFTERIPPIGTEVMVEIVPVKEKDSQKDAGVLKGIEELPKVK